MSDPSRNVLNLVKDDKKYQLLQNRLAGSEVGIINTSPIKFQPIIRAADKETLSIATLEDNIPSQTETSGEYLGRLIVEEHQEFAPSSEKVGSSTSGRTENVVIILDGSTDASSASRSSMSNKINGEESNLVTAGEKRLRNGAGVTDEEANSNSRDGFNTDSLDRSRSFPSKARKMQHNGGQDRSPIPQNDTGSREAKTKRTIVSYFSTLPNNPDAIIPSTETVKSSSTANATSSSNKLKQLKETGGMSSVMTKEEKVVVTELRKQNEQWRVAKEQAEMKVQRLETELKVHSDKTKQLDEKNSRLTKTLEDVFRTTAQQDFRRKRERLALDSVRLGKITTSRSGPNTYQDYWEEGYAWKDLTRRSAEVLEKREELEARKKRSEKLKRQAKKSTSNANPNGSANTSTNNSESEDNTNLSNMNLSEIDADLDLLTETEVIKAHFEQLKKDETTLAEEKRLLESEKAVHQKEWRRCINEERSRFYRDLPLLKERYLLLTMLGKGGFSEVWKAMDILELREVAVKIHQLNPTWSEERKSSYIKHVSREYTIHRDMKHARVVQLFDVFEIDVNSFATVLEYCKGIDLDEKLKRQRTISEKDAKAIMMQIMSGLRYLNHPFAYPNANAFHSSNNNNNDADDDIESSSSSSSSVVTAGTTSIIAAMNKKLSIIHYDLKPANILFDEFGDVKITDFGLSKVIDESCEDNTSLELTSQGAGTYWYLPPECFEKGPQPPRISSKVDVWSAGVIFYQMMFGMRPFGEGKTQEHVWSENIISNANYVEFPSDPKAPKVSDEAKDLIRACLTKDPRLRPDILTVCQHPYLKKPQ